jgi:hypothetical protein
VEGLFSGLRPWRGVRGDLQPIGGAGRRVDTDEPSTRRWTLNGGKGIYVGGTLVSILISLALYYSGRREAAIFVGLWAPTILNLGQTLAEDD